jgi:release factor glutamine methyltransferase
MTIDAFLHDAINELQRAGIVTARLDALVLLSDELRQDKAWILAHGEDRLASAQLKNLQQRLTRRASREPLAYIRGVQEFFGLNFIVTPDVLIPRPETEALIEQLLGLPLERNASVIDVGTGSGAIAISLKRVRPKLEVYATDISPAALEVARQNAKNIQADVHFVESDLLTDAPLPKFDCVIANLPYVDKSWQRSPETAFEPSLALFADDAGLGLIKKLIKQAAEALQPGGFLLLEADTKQLQTIVAFAEDIGFRTKSAEGYRLVFVR